MKKVEQIDIDGNICLDYDTSLSTKVLFESILNAFPAIRKDEDGMIIGEYDGRRFAIRAKNITYLGHPHPLYKKRIQIAGDLQLFYRNAIEKRCAPILLGVYTYGNNTLFCDFNIEDFIEKKAHNSSAHVYTSDLADATIAGYFFKEDCFGNKITVFNAKTVNAFLQNKLGVWKETDGDNCSEQSDIPIVAGEKEIVEYRFDEQLATPVGTEDSKSYEPDYELDRIKGVVMEFFAHTNRKWYGIDCYKAMIAAGYRNKYQPEWPGFFLEFEFERYLKERSLTDIIQYAQDKTKGGIDLDLFFPKIGMYGDLKAHSSNSTGIQGNDWTTVHGLIDSPKRDNHIYYIVCEHDTEKDSEHGFEVTYFWNTALGKDNLLSYSKRMKNNVQLTHAYIFDINSSNKRYLSRFAQGVNSNGRPREPKIMIDKENFARFLLSESAL